ncbi:hypothetical protein [Aquisphaera insulae]|uniref:hypothetical protein n=1 Tax=Aquisphaera insulae TaxID=2712864 RepID=UPI0013EAAA4D|nr:hypothetical protein [Aquisphaera insulae]
MANRIVPNRWLASLLLAPALIAAAGVVIAASGRAGESSRWALSDHAKVCGCGTACHGESCCCGPRAGDSAQGAGPPMTAAEPLDPSSRPCLRSASRPVPAIPSPARVVESPERSAAIFIGLAAAPVGARGDWCPYPPQSLPPPRSSRLDRPPESILVA